MVLGSEKVTCATSAAESPSGQLDGTCLGFLQRQQVAPAGGSLGPCANILGADEKPAFDFRYFLASPVASFLQSFSLCPVKPHQLQVIPLSLLPGFFLLFPENFAVVLTRTVYGPPSPSDCAPFPRTTELCCRFPSSDLRCEITFCRVYAEGIPKWVRSWKSRTARPFVGCLLSSRPAKNCDSSASRSYKTPDRSRSLFTFP